MRYVVMHKASKQDEAGRVPPKELIESMGRLVGEAVKSGVLLLGDGLKPSSDRFRVACRAGRCEVTKGPYAGQNELPAAFTAIRVKTRDEAVEWAKRYALAVGGDVDLEVGQLTEAWDLGICPKPEDAPVRFLIIHKANAATEAGAPPIAGGKAATGKLLEEMTKAGVLIYSESLLPSNKATRLNYRDHKRTVTDGPFSESKELVGGFCMMQMRSLDEILEWADRYAKILGGTLEIDVRPVADAATAAAKR